MKKLVVSLLVVVLLGCVTSASGSLPRTIYVAPVLPEENFFEKWGGNWSIFLFQEVFGEGEEILYQTFVKELPEFQVLKYAPYYEDEMSLLKPHLAIYMEVGTVIRKEIKFLSTKLSVFRMPDEEIGYQILTVGMWYYDSIEVFAEKVVEFLKEKIEEEKI